MFSEKRQLFKAARQMWSGEIKAYYLKHIHKDGLTQAERIAGFEYATGEIIANKINEYAENPNAFSGAGLMAKIRELFRLLFERVSGIISNETRLKTLYADILGGRYKDGVKVRKGSRETKYQIIGEKGAKALDEIENVSKRMDNLVIAKEMEGAGKDAKTIKLATGWEKGGDGKWRQEMEDLELIDIKFKVDKTYEIKDIIKNKEFAKFLEKAYGQLPTVHFKDIRNHGGYLAANKNEIHVSLTQSASFQKTLIHEIQHFIQFKEGFAVGGAPKATKIPLNQLYTENYDLYIALLLLRGDDFVQQSTIDSYQKYVDSIEEKEGHNADLRNVLKVIKKY